MRKKDVIKGELSKISISFLVELFRDAELTPNELYILTKGLALCYVNGECSLKDLVDVSSIGKCTIYKTLHELEKKGHCSMVEERDDKGKITKISYTFFEIGTNKIYDKYRIFGEPLAKSYKVDNEPLATNYKVDENQQVTDEKNAKEEGKEAQKTEPLAKIETHAHTHAIDEYTSYSHNNSFSYPTVEEKEKEKPIYTKENEIEHTDAPLSPPKKNFKKPTIEEIRAYIQAKGYNIDAEQFFLHYESNGWMVGKNKMKNWHAAVGTWHKQRTRYDNNNRRPTDEERRAEFARHIAAKLSRTPSNQESVDIF